MSAPDDNDERFVRIQISDLSADALQGVIESFVLREGTDYGDIALTLEQKVSLVHRQLQRGEAVIVFDAAAASIDILSPEQFRDKGHDQTRA